MANKNEFVSFDKRSNTDSKRWNVILRKNGGNSFIEFR